MSEAILSAVKSAVSASIKPLEEKIGKIEQKQTELEKKAAEPVYKHGDPRRLFAIGNADTNQQSKPYSIMKAVALAQKWMTPEQAPNEVHVSNKLREWCGHQGFKAFHPSAILVPFSTRLLPEPETDDQARFINEVRQSIKAHQYKGYDPDEADYINHRLGGHYTDMFNYIGAQKALGTISDAGGGVLVGFPTLGELIELQRNLEAFANAGAQEVALPPNGRIQYPKQTGGSTAAWIGEGSAITDSTPATGDLDLIAKKLGVFVKLNNELLRFTSPTTEALVRMDMALQAALKLDLSMLEGTGGTQIKGLITYDTQSAWVQGTDKLITYTVTSNLFQPNDPADMEAVMADTAGPPTAWLMRRNMFAKIRNRRADAVTTADGKGPFVFNITREAKDAIPLQLEGVPVVRTSQISNTRGSGAQTYVVLGNFRDWLIGRFGVMEFLVSGLGDTPFQNDQTWLRGIQHVDAGARHAASFVLADAITIS